jgi:D-glycero-D-manno-heptose 1,7-bisphosphate phosphatase
LNKRSAGGCLREKSTGIASPLPLVDRGDFLHIPATSRFLPEGKEGNPQFGQAVFLDRDGVLIEDVNYLTRTDQIRLVPGVTDALRSLQSLFSLIVITNQSGIARGILTEDDLAGIHAELVSLLAIEGVILDALYFCPHLPEGIVPTYSWACTCRKPSPGMLLQASQDFSIDLCRSFLIGDRHSDIQAGAAAGVESILLSGNYSPKGGSGVVVLEIAEAAELIINAQESSSTNPPIQRGLACQ